MKKLYFFVLTLLSCAGGAIAQQDAQFSQYMLNQLYFNPATAGLNREFNEMNMLYRSQWTGYQSTFDDGGAPNTFLFTGSMPLTKYNTGVGLQVMNDRLGPVNTLEIQLSLAYHLKLKGDKRLSIGARGGAYNYRLDASRLRWVDPTDPLRNAGSLNQFVPDFAAGIYFSDPKYFLGAAINHLSQAQLEQTASGQPITYTSLARHLNFMGGYHWKANQVWTITPSAILKSDLNSLSWEASAVAMYDERLSFGLSYRDSDAAILLLGFQTPNKKLRINYAFDYVTQGRNAKSGTSHELMLSYRLPAIKFFERSPVRTPRFRYDTGNF